MWKALPLIILLASCTTADKETTAAGEDSSPAFRIVNSINIPLTPTSSSNTEQTPTKEFRQGEVSGDLQQTGTWTITNPVIHNRLRCATYETGIQIGQGDQACSEVKWLTGINYGTSRTHCNSAPLIHIGGGEFAEIVNTFSKSNCVRVVTRCEGGC